MTRPGSSTRVNTQSFRVKSRFFAGPTSAKLKSLINQVVQEAEESR